MSRITELTQEQIADMKNVRDYWIRVGLSTGPFDVEVIRPAINLLYANIGKEPPRIVRCESPRAAQLTINDLDMDSVGYSVWDSVWDSVRDSVRDSVWYLVRSSVWDSVGDSVRVSVEFTTRWNSTPLWGCYDAHWIAYYKYFAAHFPDIFTDTQHDLIEAFSTIAHNASFWYAYEDVCLVCDRPSELHIDDDGKLHNENGPAVRFPDGWSIYARHGEVIPDPSK